MVFERKIWFKMNKTVLITGASGGLGKAMSILYAAKGWHVYACDVAKPFPVEFQGADGISFFEMDVTSDRSVKAVFEKLQSDKVVLDVIINNAGIDRYFPLSEAPVECFREVFEVNVFGVYRVNQVFLPLLKSPGGRIVHIGSESLNLTVPFLSYPLSKKLLEGYAKVLRQELKFSGVDVVVIRPGAIETPLLNQVKTLSSVRENWKLAPQFRKFAEGAVKEIGKVIRPEEVAEFVYKKSIIPDPSAVYRINNSLQLRIAALLPFRLLEKIVGKRLS
jgi:NAD(P)-dependent dehydrogenase (short-subunit alcohol dehydrogenase family)